MAQINDYALLSAAVYKTSLTNKIDVNGWTELTRLDSISGFYAKSYRNGNEIVIAYSGTTPGIADWLTGNAAAFSLPASQIFEAMKFYLDVKAANPGASITFTGHSLGGGLASLMGVFFDKQAVTFDEAPFGLTAINPVLISALEAYLLVNGYTDLAFAEYNASFTTLFWLWESNVSHIYLANEVLAPLRDVIHGIAGSNTRIDMGDSNLTNPVALHSMTLLAAMWLDTDFASLVQQLPNFAVYLRDSNWFGVEDPNGPKADLLTNLLNEQYGPQNNGKLDAFVTDLQQLLGTDGTALSNLGVRDALMVSAMEYYYNKINMDADLLFTVSDGGIHFKYSDIGDDTYGTQTQLAHELSFLLSPEANTTDYGIFVQLMQQDAWHIQSGSDGMTWTATNNDRDAVIGGVEADVLNAGEGEDILFGLDGSDGLNGGTDSDWLYGGQGNDTLNGGEGNDILQGGDGADTYTFTGTYGIDFITDSDGLGSITIDGQAFSSASQKSENIYKNDSSGYTVVKINGGTGLIISKAGDANSIIVNEWSEAKNLGISLQNATPTPPAATLTGDFKKKIDDHGSADTGDDTYVMTNGNYTADEKAVDGDAGALDLITGAAGNDVIDGKAGSDALSGKAGDDYIEGGTEGDVIQGGLGEDTINGGAGDDFLYGSSDLDINKPTLVNFIRPVNDFSYPQATGFNWFAGYETTRENGVPISFLEGPRNRLADDQGNIIDGGAGNDFIAAGTGADYAHGGADKDEIWGMDKDDILFGDSGNDLIYGDGNKPNDYSTVWSSPENHGNDLIDGGEGDDIVYGQGGNDIIYGGANNDLIWGDDIDPNLPTANHGNDYLNGGDNNDQLVGGGKDDTLMGGSGEDTLYGDDETLPEAYQGNDYLDGGAGDDYLRGYGGDDMLLGGVGHDTMQGEAGNDTLLGSDGIDTLFGENDDDYLEGGADNDELFGGAGDDLLLGDAGDDRLQGGEDNDTLDGGADNDLLFGEGGDDSLSGNDGNDELQGNEGDDYLDGDTGDDRLFGQDGDDSLDDETGNNLLRGGVGLDSLTSGAGNDKLYGDEGDDRLVAGGGLDTLLGGADNDLLDGGFDADQLFGQDGDDNLQGGSGLDRLQGGAGDDALDGGEDSDLLFGEIGADNLFGSSGADRLHGNEDNDSLDGGEDDDMLYGETGNDTLLGGDGFDQLQGNEGDDNLNGGAGDDWLYGQSGNDLLSDEQDDNLLAGGEGSDTLITGAGDDELYGNAGDDILSGGNGWDIINGGSGSDSLQGGAGGDTYMINSGDGIDRVKDFFEQGYSGIRFDNVMVFGQGIYANNLSLGLGSLLIKLNNNGDAVHIEGFNPDAPYANPVISRFEFADGTVLLLSRGFDLSGTPDADVINGTGADDRIDALDSDDLVYGKDGNDTLNGGNGADTLQGGNGDDVYNVDDSGDAVVENSGEGQDKVLSSISYALPANIESLTLAVGTALIGSGNELDNELVGNNGDNQLYGLEGNDALFGNAGSDTLDGGSGGDALAGGDGDDLYAVDDSGDTVTEYADSGQDRVDSGVSFSLAANIEDLKLLGDAALDGTGNELNNSLTGNNGDNQLYGLDDNDALFGNAGNDLLDGGSGSDTLLGGSGDDRYAVDDGGDALTENADDGIDTVYSSVSYLLGANLENLALFDGPTIDGYGNELANRITGNDQANWLDGLEGADRLIDGVRRQSIWRMLFLRAAVTTTGT